MQEAQLRLGEAQAAQLGSSTTIASIRVQTSVPTRVWGQLYTNTTKHVMMIMIKLKFTVGNPTLVVDGVTVGSFTGGATGYTSTVVSFINPGSTYIVKPDPAWNGSFGGSASIATWTEHVIGT